MARLCGGDGRWAITALMLITVAGLVATFPVNRALVEDAETTLDLYRNDAELQHSLRLHRLRRTRHRQRKLNSLKAALVYLHSYGYLDNLPLTPPYVTKALRAFQRTAGVEVTGDLNRGTIAAMHTPRCGNRDIETTRAKRPHVRIECVSKRCKRFTKVSRWTNELDENNVLSLKWYIEKYTNDIPRDDIRDVVTKAFNIWSRQNGIPTLPKVTLNFQEAAAKTESDITILWATGDHGDPHRFDDGGGASNVLAHTYYPKHDQGSNSGLNGDIHMDDWERWVLDNSNEQGPHFPYVLVHEIGHALGLGHSRKPDAVMNPIYKKVPLTDVRLTWDDKCALNWNYVGESRMCFHIWLLVELLPRQKGAAAAAGSSTSTDAPRSTSGGNVSDLEVSIEWNSENLEQRINETLTDLQQTKIPICTTNNDVQLKYEVLLEHKLDFPRDSARRYGPVVCNFLDGLSEELRLSTGAEIANIVDESGDSVPLLTAHAYHRHDSDTGVHLERADTDDQRKRRRRRRIRPRNEMLRREYYNHDFFQHLFELYLADQPLTR